MSFEADKKVLQGSSCRCGRKLVAFTHYSVHYREGEYKVRQKHAEHNPIMSNPPTAAVSGLKQLTIVFRRDLVFTRARTGIRDRLTQLALMFTSRK